MWVSGLCELVELAVRRAEGLARECGRWEESSREGVGRFGKARHKLFLFLPQSRPLSGDYQEFIWQYLQSRRRRTLRFRENPMGRLLVRPFHMTKPAEQPD